MNILGIKSFQILLLFIFGIIAIVGLLVFASARTGGERVEQVGTVVIWGLLPEQAVRDTIRSHGGAYRDVTYREITPEEFHTTYTQALALSRGPDIILVSQEFLRAEYETLSLISETAYTPRDFEASFVGAADVLRAQGGYFGLPVAIDPLVMFYNRPLLDQARVPEPPRYWEQFFGLAPRLSVVEQGFALSQSMVALGSYNNIAHAKRVISALFFQTGTPIVDSSWRAVLAERPQGREAPAESALRFYTEFANPSKASYSWNAGMPQDRRQFLEGKLALYFAPASEGPLLREANPNLNFAPAPFPQLEGQAPVVYADLYFAGLVHSTRNPQGARSVLFTMAGEGFGRRLAEASGVTPVARSTLGRVQTDPLRDIAYEAALIARTWASPQPSQVANAFSAMVGGVVSGQRTVREALEDVARALR